MKVRRDLWWQFNCNFALCFFFNRGKSFLFNRLSSNVESNRIFICITGARRPISFGWSLQYLDPFWSRFYFSFWSCLQTTALSAASDTPAYGRLQRGRRAAGRHERTSSSPAIITAAGPESFYNSKTPTLHKEAIIALGVAFHSSINDFFLSSPKDLHWNISLFPWKPPHEKMWNFSCFHEKKLSTWDDRWLCLSFWLSKTSQNRAIMWC